MHWGAVISSHKMRSPAFPPRRPSAILRYLIPAFLIITLLYYLREPAKPYTPPTSAYQAPSQPPLIESQTNGNTNTNKNGQISQQSPAGKNGEQSTEYTVKQQHDVNQPRPLQEPLVDSSDKTSHPIDRLITTANQQFDEMMRHESHTLSAAAAAYRARRGRHPPPGFDQWYAFATSRKAVIVEDFWDQIYHDLEPFWALSAGELRKGAWDYEMTINVRSGVAYAQSDWFWTQIWLSMVQTVAHLLPDMDLALNAMDEPRLVVPWEKMNKYMSKASATKGMVPAKEAENSFERLPQRPSQDAVLPEKDWEGTSKSFDVLTCPPARLPTWETSRGHAVAIKVLTIDPLTEPYWKVTQRGCAPDSPTRKAEVMTSWDHAPVFTPNLAEPHMYKGFVSNYTLSTSICHQPDLQGLNGIFINPQTVSATKTLFPMFGGSKLSVNNEILLPAPMYWNEEERFTGGGDTGVAWDKKFDGVVWRGVATGGRNLPENWRAFQRHRFVAMNNATKIERAEDWTELPLNFELPSSAYDLAAQKPVQPGLPRTRLGEWTKKWADVAFVDLMCPEEEPGYTCYYTSPHYSIEDGIRLADQFNWKYLPDIDGNSFSGRYLGFLRSTSLPIKATVYKEWHDSRLVAWKHFVPMDNRYGDWWGIMEYFLGYDGAGDEKAKRKAHDEQAAKIARDGKDWAERVLRKEDMQIYVLRLLLEYARVSDPRREKMGWADDLLGKVT